MKPLLLVVSAATLAAAASSQNVLGFTAGNNTSYTDRIGANNVVADGLNHYDDRDYLDWMLDPADPTGATYKFQSVRLIVQDQIGTTPETFTVVGYNEDPSNPNYPDPTAVWFRSGTITLPASTATGPVAWIYTVTLNVPAAPKGDKWLGVGMDLPLSGTWPTDGLSTHITADRPATFTSGANRDLPSTAISQMPMSNVGCFVPTSGGLPTGPATYPAITLRRQIWFEITANVASGVPVTQTNQTIYPSSNPGGANPLVPLGGTTNMFSGLYPDVNDTTATSRNDDIGFLVNDVSVPNGLVFVMVAFGPNPLGSLPLSLLMGASANPATKGNVCIDFTTAASFLGVANATGVYQHMLTLNPAVRNALVGLSPISLWYQGFVVNTASSPGMEVHATGCGIQHF
jgi:hypothetical protein